MWRLACLVSLPFLVDTAGNRSRSPGGASPQKRMSLNSATVAWSTRASGTGVSPGYWRIPPPKTEACSADQFLEGMPAGKLNSARQLNSVWSGGMGGRT